MCWCNKISVVFVFLLRLETDTRADGVQIVHQSFCSLILLQTIWLNWWHWKSCWDAWRDQNFHFYFFSNDQVLVKVKEWVEEDQKCLSQFPVPNDNFNMPLNAQWTWAEISVKPLSNIHSTQHPPLTHTSNLLSPLNPSYVIPQTYTQFDQLMIDFSLVQSTLTDPLWPCTFQRRCLKWMQGSRNV